MSLIAHAGTVPHPGTNAGRSARLDDVRDLGGSDGAPGADGSDATGAASDHRGDAREPDRLRRRAGHNHPGVAARADPAARDVLAGRGDHERHAGPGGHRISGASRLVAGSMELVLLTLGIAIGAAPAGVLLDATITDTPINTLGTWRRGSARSRPGSAATRTSPDRRTALLAPRASSSEHRACRASWGRSWARSS